MVKIVFCLPGRDYSREFLLSWSDLLMQANHRGHQIMISQHYSSVVHFSRIKCLGGDVLQGPDQNPFQGKVEYDVMMWIDSDIIFKPEDFFDLLESPHDVTAGIYMNEDMQTFSAVRSWNDDIFAKTGSFKYLRPDDIVGAPQYIPVDYAGMGWMMIRKGVIEDLKYPWFWSPLQSIGDLVDMNAEDVSLCRAMNTAGHQVYIDSKIRVGHQKAVII